MKDIFEVFRAIQLDLSHESYDDINGSIVSLDDCSMKTRQPLNFLDFVTEDISNVNTHSPNVFLLDRLFFVSNNL